MSISHSCPVNPIFLVIAIFHLNNYYCSQSSQVTLNSKEKSLTKSKYLLENFSFKMFCDVIFSSLLSQYDVSSFKIANFQLDDYP